MPIQRREFIAFLTAGTAVTQLPGCTTFSGVSNMYGLIGKMKTVPGQRDAFTAILLEGIANMPGCLSYIVAKDNSDDDALWITEVWDSPESHKASLQLPGVKEAIAKGRPMIASFGDQVQTEPIGGIGLPR